MTFDSLMVDGNRFPGFPSKAFLNVFPKVEQNETANA
jgi:hypothetical protein